MYKEKKSHFCISRKSKLDEMLDAVFDDKRKLINMYKARRKEIMMEKDIPPLSFEYKVKEQIIAST